MGWWYWCNKIDKVNETKQLNVKQKAWYYPGSFYLDS